MSGGLCAYRDMFGKPGEGAHSIRIFDVAVVDVVATLIGAWFIASAVDIGYGWALLGLFLAGIVLHRLFCVRTRVDRWLWLDPVDQ